MSDEQQPIIGKIISRDAIAEYCDRRRARGERIVFTNGCFDILHAGHVELLHNARGFGDCLVVGLNSNASVRRLKGASRPLNGEDARALVLAALADVDAVCIFEEDTPVALIEAVRPHVHVKGGDYRPEDLPEAEAVRRCSGNIEIVPLRAGFSTTKVLEQLQEGARKEVERTSLSGDTAHHAPATRCVLVIPARFGSTRFPGKPLALLDGRPVIEHVVRAGLQSQVDRPVLVATDDGRIAAAITGNFREHDVEVVMTSSNCQTGTDRIAQAIQMRFAAHEENSSERLIVINVQGDEPFINPQHVDALIAAMKAEPSLSMGTLATPIRDVAQVDDTNVVKVVLDKNDYALYFSRLPIPYKRPDGGDTVPEEKPKLRHLGVYAYSADWLQQMAQLPPTPLEESEKLEQLRALENGVRIKVVVVGDVINIAIDTPQDLQMAELYLKTNPAS